MALATESPNQVLDPFSKLTPTDPITGTPFQKIKDPFMKDSEGLDLNQVLGNGVYDKKEGSDQVFTTDGSVNPDDYKFNIMPGQDYTEERAQYQGTAAKLAAIVPNVISQTLTEIGKMPGFLAGAVDWAAQGFKAKDIGLMVDNTWVNAMDNLDTKIKSILPIYATKQAINGNIGQQLLTPEFWATDAADGLGFLLAYIAPGAAIKAMGMGATIARGIGTTGKVAEGIDMGIMTTVNTLFESASEAGSVVQDMKKFYKDAIANQQINSKTGNPYTQSEADQAIGDAGVSTFLANTAILIGPNYIMNKNLLGAISLGEKGASQIIDRAAANMAEAGTGNVTKAVTRNAILKEMLGSMASEGLWEEGSQSAVSNYFTKKGEGKTTAGVFHGLAQEYADMLTTTDGQKSVLLGALMGAVGGGIGVAREKRHEKKAVISLTELLNQNMESTLKSVNGIYQTETKDGKTSVVLDENGKPKVDHSKLVTAFQNMTGEEMNSARLERFAETGNKDAYEELFNDTFTRFTLPYLQQEGGLEVLNKHIDKLSSEVATQMIRADGGKNIESIKESLKTRAKDLQTTYDHVSPYNNGFFNIKATTKAEKTRRTEFIGMLQTNVIAETARQKFYDRQIAKYESDLLTNQSLKTVANDEIAKQVQKHIETLKVAKEQSVKNQKLLFNKEAQQDAFSKHVQNAEDINEKVQAATDQGVPTSVEIDDLLKNHTRTEKLTERGQEHTILHSDELEMNLFDSNGTEIKNEKENWVKYTRETKKAALVAVDKKIAELEMDKTGIGKDKAGRESQEHNNIVIALRKQHAIRDGIESGKFHSELIGTKPVPNRFRITRKMSNGDLQLINIKTERTAYLKQDGTVNYYGDESDPKKLISSKFKTFKSVKSADQVRKEFQKNAALQLAKKAISYYEQKIENITDEISQVTEDIEKISKALRTVKSGKKARYEGVAMSVAQLSIYKTKAEALLTKLIEQRKEYETTMNQYISGKETVQANDPETDKGIIDAYKDNIRIYRSQVEILKDNEIALQDMIDTISQKIVQWKAWLGRLGTEYTNKVAKYEKILRDKFADPEFQALFMNSTTEEFNKVLQKLGQPISERLEEINSDQGKADTRIDNAEKEIEKLTQDLQEVTDKIEAVKKTIKKTDGLYRKLVSYYLDAKGIRVGSFKKFGIANDFESYLTEQDAQVAHLDKIEQDKKKNNLTPFRGVDSFDSTTGNQEENLKVLNDITSTSEAKRDALNGLRWYAFVNAYDYGQYANGKRKQVIFTHTYAQVAEMDKKSELYKNLRFFIPSLSRSLTSEELSKELPAVQAEAAKDIKLVVYDTSYNEKKEESLTPHLIQDNLVWTSMPDPTFVKTSGYKRFSFEKRVEEVRMQILREQFDEEPKPGSESYEALNELIDKTIEEEKASAIEEYEERRASYIEESTRFNIGVKNSGYRVPLDMGEKTSDVVGSILEEKDIVTAEFKTDKTGKLGTAQVETLYGKPYQLLPGITYLWNKLANTLEKLSYRVLNGEEIDTYVDLLKTLKEGSTIIEGGKSHLATAADRANVRSFLDTIVVLNTNSNSNYYFRMHTTKNDEFVSVEFGTQRMTKEELEKGGEKLNQFREFLTSKYHAVNFDAIHAGTNFTEYSAKNGKIRSSVWEKSLGGYKAFLLSTKDGRKAKVMGNVRSRVSSDPMENAKDPQYINSKFNLNISKGRPVKVVIKTKPKVEIKKFGVLVPGKIYTVRVMRGETPSVADGMKVKWDGSTLEFIGNEAQIKANAPTNLKDFLEGIEEEGFKGEDILTEAEAKGLTVSFPDAHVNIASKTPEVVKVEMDADQLAEFNRINSHRDEAHQISSEIFMSAYKASKVYNTPIEVILADTAPIYFRQTLPTENLVDMGEEFKYLRELFPEFDMEKMDLEGNTGGMVIDAMKLLLANSSTIGTGYHEAYHVVSLAFMNSKQRQKLYSEVRMRTGNLAMTDIETEEYLAEEFRMYKLSKGNYKFGVNQPATRTWFQKLIAFLSRLFNHDIENTFETLDSKPYYTKDRKDQVKGTFKKVNELSEATTNALADQLNFEFFRIIFDSNDVNFTKLTSENPDLSGIYQTIHDRMVRYAAFQKDTDTEKTWAGVDLTLRNWEGLVKLHMKFLRQNGMHASAIDLNERSQDQDESSQTVKEQVITNDSPGNNEPNLIDVKLLMPSKIKVLLMGLPSVEKINNDSKIPSYIAKNKQGEGFIYHANQRYTETITFLHNNLAGINTLAGMVEKLKSIESENKHPEVGVLLKRLQLWENNPSVTIEQHALQTAFFIQFAKNKNNPIITFLKNSGNIIFLDAVNNAIQDRLQTQWRNNVKNESGSANSLFNTNNKGEFVVDTNKVLTIDSKKFKWSDMVKNKGILESLSTSEKLSLLRTLGIEMPVDSSQIADIDKIKKYLSKLMDNLSHGATLDDLYNPEKTIVNKEFLPVLTLAANLTTDVQDLQFLNGDNKTEYSIALNSYLTQHIHDFKDAIEGYLKPAGQGGLNLSTVGSVLVKNTQEGRPPRIVILTATKTEFENGENTASLNYTDFATTSFNAVLNGFYPMVVSGDRSLAYAIDPQLRVEDKDAELKLDRATINDRLSEYLVSEVATVMAHQLEIGSDLKNFSRFGGELRVFKIIGAGKKDIISSQDIQKFLADSDIDGNKGYNAEVAARIVTLAREFVKKNSSKVNLMMKIIMMDGMKNNLNLLKETGVVVAKGDEWLPLGINQEAIEKIFGKRMSSLSDEQLSEIVRIVTYKYMEGALEQMKTIIGDTSNYNNLVDFPKRVKAVESSKKAQRNDQDHIDFTGKNFPKFIGSYNKNVRMAIWEDKSIPLSMRQTNNYNKILGTKENPYAEGFPIADGQTKGTLGFTRQMFLNEDSWTEPMEITYQYEMQAFALRLMRNSRIPQEAAESLFHNAFGDHTGKVIPSFPMYNGERISLKNCGVIPIYKPQGYGPLANPDASFMTNMFVLKTSIAPIFLSTLSDDSPMFKHVTSMIINGVDLMVFDSSSKMETYKPQSLFDDKGNMNMISKGEEGTKIQEVSFDHIGIQLDVDPKVKDRATVSTQKRRMEGLNLFALGEALVDHAGDLKTQQIELTNELSKRGLAELADTLGLKKVGNNYLLDKENSKSLEKFRNTLKDEFERRLMPDNAIEGLDLVLDSNDILFDTLFLKNKIQQVLNSLVRNRAISMKTNGNMLIQESSIGYDEELKFYEYSNDNDQISEMEVMIGLPADWIPMVEKIGGMDKFNALVATRDYAALGMEEKMFLFSANRIPTQAINSLEVARIKKFLPPYAGSRIVLPAAIVVKSGTDFDVDKLTAYFANYTMENGIPKYIDFNTNSLESQSKAALENRLNEISMKMLLHPQNYKLLVTPNSSDTLLGFAEVMTPYLKREGATALEMTQWSRNVETAQHFWAGKALIAVAAIHNVSHAVSQRAPVRIADPLVEIWFENQTGDGLKMGYDYDEDGYVISENFSEFLTAFVDVAKKPFIFWLNANKYAFPIYSFLNRFGSGNPTSIRTIAEFMTQPVVVKFVQEFAKSQSMTMKTAKNRDDIKYEADTTAKIFNKLLENSGGNYKNSLANLYKQYFAEEEGPKKEKLVKDILLKKTKLNYGSLKLNQADLKSNKKTGAIDAQILDMFLIYKEYSKKLDEFHQVTRPDGNFPKSMNGTAYILYKEQKLKDSKFFNNDDVVNFLEKTELKGFHDAWLANQALFGSFFMTGSKEFRPLIDDLIKMYDGQFGMDVEYVLDKFEADFTNYIIHTNSELSMDDKQLFPKTLNKVYRELFTGKNSVATQLLSMRKILPNNYLLNELQPVFNPKISNRRLNLSKTDNVKLFARKYTADESNRLTLGFAELYDSVDSKVKTFAVNLAALSLVQNGMSRTPISFTDVIPAAILQPAIQRMIASFKSELGSSSPKNLTQIIDSFQKTNYQDKRITPRADWRHMYDKVKGLHTGYAQVPFGHSLSKFNNLTWELPSVSPEQVRLLKKENKIVPKEVVLYVKSRSVVEQGKKYHVYKRTDSGLGEGQYAKEFYTTSQESWMQSNSTQYEEAMPEFDGDFDLTADDFEDYSVDYPVNKQYSSILAPEMKRRIANMDQEKIKSIGVKEINKHSKQIKDTINEASQELLANFDTYFPAQKDFTADQRATFVKLFNKGHFEITC